MMRIRIAELRSLAMATCATLAIGSTAAAAQDTQGTAYSLSAQPLGAALGQLGRDSGREIIVPADLVRGRQAPAVAAPSVETALDSLLRDTGLHFRTNDSGTIIVGPENLPSAPASKSPVRPALPAHRSEFAPDAPARLEEIVVTAQRREERGQDVPVAVSAFGANAIEAFRLDRLRDISRLTPGLLVSSFSQSSPTIAIRGATNTFTQIGANKPVAVVVDDVFIPRNSAADFELFGLSSIQVLRGPQGTLFGRNVTGGAILLDTGRPAFGETAAHLRGTIGNYSARAIEGLVDAPVGDRVAVRIAGAVRERDGFGRDRLTGREQDDQNDSSVRGQVRVQPTPDVELLLGADYSDDRNGGRTLSSIAAGSDGDRRTSEVGVPQRFARVQKGGSARLYWDVAGGRVTSVTGYRDSQTGELFSNVGANFAFLTGTQSQQVTDDADSVEAFSQEVRFASPDWNWGHFIVGAYYLDESSRRRVQQQAFAAQTGAVLSDQAADQAVDGRSYAAFADATLKLPAQAFLTLGARYTHDRKEASLVRTDRLRPANGFALGDLSKSWEEVTPRAILGWQPTRDLLAYLSYSRGYTAGGFNTDAATPGALATPFDPETVENYEAGVKSEWLEGQLRLNASIFRMVYSDKQELFFNNLTRILNITNAAEARSQGVEIEAQLVPTDWLSLGATYGHLDTRYEEFVIPGGPVYTGNPLGSSPRHKVSFSGTASWPVAAWGELFGTATYSRTSDYFTGASADPGLRVPDYALVNLSAGLAAADGEWRITAFVRNATRTNYLLTPSTQTVRAEYLGEPRTYGLTAAWSF